MSYEPQYKTGKRKVWRFGSEWTPEKRFIKQALVNGEWIEKSYTLEEARTSAWFFGAGFAPPRPL